jgi:hypothetical protein
MLSARTVRNIEAVVILAAAIAASIFVPYETLMPGAIGVMAVAVAGVWFIRTRMQKLDPRESGPQREFLLEIGTALAMAGLAAFLVLVIELAD